jgi:hypothetical protein
MRTKLSPAPLGGWDQHFELESNLTGMILLNLKLVITRRRDM